MFGQPAGIPQFSIFVIPAESLSSPLQTLVEGELAIERDFPVRNLPAEIGYAVMLAFEMVVLNANLLGAT